MKFKVGILAFALLACHFSLSAQTAEINHLEIGLNQNKSGNYADALRNFTLEIEKTAANPNPIAFYNRGFAKYNLKDFQGAILATVGRCETSGWSKFGRTLAQEAVLLRP